MDERRRAAFERELMPELGAVYSAARRLAPSPADAEDLAQETMLRAFRAYDPGRPPTHPRGWLQAILLNLVRDRARRDARAPAPLSLEDEGAGLYDRLEAGVETGPLSDPARLVRRWDDRELVRSCLAELPGWARQVLVLAHVAGLRYREIAESTGVPIGTVMSRLSRARRMLEGRVADRMRLPAVEEPRLAPAPADGSAGADDLRRAWGGAPRAADALAGSPALLASAEAATRAMTADGALPGEVKRRILEGFDGGAPAADPAVAALVALAVRAARAPADVTRADYEIVYGEGWTEEQVVEALHVAAWAGYLTTMNLALGGGSPGS